MVGDQDPSPALAAKPPQEPQQPREPEQSPEQVMTLVAGHALLVERRSFASGLLEILRQDYIEIKIQQVSVSSHPKINILFLFFPLVDVPPLLFCLEPSALMLLQRRVARVNFSVTERGHVIPAIPKEVSDATCPRQASTSEVDQGGALEAKGPATF